MACTRYFGADVDVVVTGPIEVTWKGERQLNVRAGGDAGVDWVIELGSSVVSRAMSAVASALPERAWRSGPVLAMMSRVVGSVLGVGRVRLTGRTPNGHQFVVNPRPIWWVTRSSATIASENLVPIGPLQEQAHLADFWIPQRGLIMVGGARLRARQPVEKGFTGQDATHVHQRTSRRLPCPEKQ